MNMNIDDIIKVTKLSKDKILKLKSEGLIFTLFVNKKSLI